MKEPTTAVALLTAAALLEGAPVVGKAVGAEGGVMDAGAEVADARADAPGTAAADEAKMLLKDPPEAVLEARLAASVENEEPGAAMTV